MRTQARKALAIFAVFTIVALATYGFTSFETPSAQMSAAALQNVQMADLESATNTAPAAMPATSTTAVTPLSTSSDPTMPYVEVTDSCGPQYQGTCINMRSGPGTEYPSVLKLRTGMVLKVAQQVTNDKGETWYKIDPGNGLRYPERVTDDWYVSANLVSLMYDKGDRLLATTTVASTSKRIVVDLSDEMLYAYDGDTLFMQEKISRGLDDTPTPKGTFTVYKMTPSRYMQGPIEGISDQFYDLPGVPWNLYFTQEGAVIHGAYWHNHFGEPWSHGCVNLPPDKAKELYEWAEVGMQVTIRP